VRFLFFDRIVDAERGKRMRALKHVTLMDGYLDAHFPRQAVMPGTLLMESLAQVGGMLNLLNHNFTVEMVLMLVDGVRLRRQVRQGEPLTLEVQMLYDHPYGATMRAEARVSDDVVATIDRMVYAHKVVTDPAKIKNNRDRFDYQSGGWAPPEDATR
jgi:3-hydroxymyristoyl/3-hydroxydecanoyl-(acyl carrier protein) dehydratase